MQTLPTADTAQTAAETAAVTATTWLVFPDPICPVVSLGLLSELTHSAKPAAALLCWLASWPAYCLWRLEGRGGERGEANNNS